MDLQNDHLVDEPIRPRFRIKNQLYLHEAAPHQPDDI